jgi:hypothetical protein
MIEYKVVVDDGSTRWRVNGLLHREGDLPAIEYSDGSKEWWLNGLPHREGGPAVEWVGSVCGLNKGFAAWLSNGLLHREGDLPAMEYTDGGKRWYKNGLLHRDNGPAVEHGDGSKEWWKDGQLRPDAKLKSKAGAIDTIDVRYTDGTHLTWGRGFLRSNKDNICVKVGNCWFELTKMN